MYNFAGSQLKAWIDRILVVGKTFQYGEKGLEGLAFNKRVTSRCHAAFCTEAACRTLPASILYLICAGYSAEKSIEGALQAMALRAS
jgi:Flavodoxin-like fold